MVKLIENGMKVNNKEGLDKVYDRLYVKNIFNIRKIAYTLNENAFESTRKLNYYYNKLKNKLASLHYMTEEPYNETFYSYIIDRPANYSVVIKVYELNSEFYNSNKELVHIYNPSVDLFNEVNNEWKFYKESPINKSPVSIEIEDSKTFIINKYQLFNTNIKNVIKDLRFYAVNSDTISLDEACIGTKLLRNNITLANKLASEEDYEIDASKYERSTIMIMKLELRNDMFDFSKPVTELYKDALKELVSFSNAYGLGILDENTWINTTLEYFNPTFVVHFVKLEENINNNDDMHIERIISNAIDDLQNNRNLHSFKVNRLMVEQDVNIFISEDGNNLTSHKKYEIARDFDNDEYIVVKPENSVYPDLKTMYRACKSKNEYITKVVASSVTGADEYFDNYPKLNNGMDDNSHDECIKCCKISKE